MGEIGKKAVDEAVHTARETVRTVSSETRESSGQIRSWFDNIREGTGLWDRGSRRKRTRRGSSPAGRGIR